MTTTAISAVVPRRPCLLAGRVTAVASYVRPWVRLDVDLCDGTGTITLRFLGRTEVPGIIVTSRLGVEGTPWREGDSFVMLNPTYMFLDENGYC